MLMAHVNPALIEQRYDAPTDFVVEGTSEAPRIQPQTPDATIVFGMLQHVINRVLRRLERRPVLENGVLDDTTYAAVVAIANAPQPITSALFPWLAKLTPNLAYRDYPPLAVFRTNPIGVGLLDLAARARTWTTIFRGLADAGWYASTTPTDAVDASMLPPPTPAARWPLFLAMLAGATLGVVGTIALHGQRRA